MRALATAATGLAAPALWLEARSRRPGSPTNA